MIHNFNPFLDPSCNYDLSLVYTTGIDESLFHTMQISELVFLHLFHHSSIYRRSISYLLR